LPLWSVNSAAKTGTIGRLPVDDQDVVVLTRAQIVRPVMPGRRGITFGKLRLELMRDFEGGAFGTRPIVATRRALARIDELNLWPAYSCSWKYPFGQFLIELAPLLDNPDIVLSRYQAARQSEVE
jgi:hypothetical protein